MVVYIMGSIIQTVKQTESANNRFLRKTLHGVKLSQLTGGNKRRTSWTRQVMNQAIWYIGAFYVTFAAATTNRLIQQIADKTYFPVICIHALFEPSQGFLNYLVYLRPRYLNYHEKNPDVTKWQVIRLVFARNPEEVMSQQYSSSVPSCDQNLEDACRNELASWRRWRRVLRHSRKSKMRGSVSVAWCERDDVIDEQRHCRMSTLDIEPDDVDRIEKAVACSSRSESQDVVDDLAPQRKRAFPVQSEDPPLDVGTSSDNLSDEEGKSPEAPAVC